MATRLTTRPEAFSIGILALVIAGLYVPTVAEMVRQWSSHPYAGYAMFVPAFSAVVLYTDRKRLRNAVGPGARAGYAVVALGLGLFAVGQWALGFTARGVSLVVVIAGLGLALLGTRWVTAAAFPLAYLVLMIPPPLAVFKAVTFHAQLFVAATSAGLLRLLDVPLVRDGLNLRLPQITLEVAEACNGFRFLTSLVVLMIAFSRLALDTPGRRVLLVTLAVPAAVTANVLRVTVTGLAAHLLGPEETMTFVHYWAGKGIWLVTIAVLVATGLLLRGSARSTTGSLGRREVRA